jgi:hypothetical protein
MDSSPNSAESDGWSRISPAHIDRWNDVLLRTGASYHQYPFWTEPYRRMGVKPIYLGYGSNGLFTAYACIQTVGVPGFRLGMIVDGPVGLQAESAVDEQVLLELTAWAKRAGYVFLKFSHYDPAFMGVVGALPNAEVVNAFPFFGSQEEALVVELSDNEEAMLASFQAVCRYEIRAASRAGYEIVASDSAQDFAAVWPMFERLSQRKGFRLYRPLDGWQDLILRASPNRCARLYSASLGSKTVQAIMVVRDARTAQYMLGALDIDELEKNPSPACLLHWHAMRDIYRLGCTTYNLGPPSGVVYQFKRKFRPVHHVPPPPITVVINKRLYWLWARLVLRAALPMWPYFRSLRSRTLHRR